MPNAGSASWIKPQGYGGREALAGHTEDRGGNGPQNTQNDAEVESMICLFSEELGT